MQLAMIGAGRMGSSMVRRLLRAGHECVVYDANAAAAEALVTDGATAARSFEDLVQRLAKPRTVWLMLPAGIVDREIAALSALLEPGDIVIDGGNSHFASPAARAATASWSAQTRTRSRDWSRCSRRWRHNDDYANRVLSAMRREFGGH